ncbi:MAG: NAD-dependent epimerase/dehydratase family protein [Candidatus Micrarchaeota archaeon]|nr:NAD-dependent epimerase/dehydratase family protein [Candidatus Micrarchaeota archaeon]
MRLALFAGKNVAVTGGAGFIGSHVVDELLAQGAKVTVIDNMRSGQPKVVEEHKRNGNYTFRKTDITDLEGLRGALKGTDFVFHMAANADIRGGMKNTRIDLDINTIGTYNVLEAMRANDVKGICFTSSAALYGEQKIIPTPEDAPLIQNSLYGASKLAGEALCQAFSEYYGMRNYIYRFVSIVGERYPHGCIIDFYRKLKKNPEELEVLGDGTQKKSFLYIKDCVSGVMAGIEKGKGTTNIFNLGNDYTIEISRVADIVIEEMGLKAKKRYTGGKVGWKGDQPIVLLSTERIRALGWKPKTSIEEGIRRTVKYLVASKPPL